MFKTNFPIPGQSLTDKPKNAPWENPPEIVDPEEAMMYHLDRLNDEERMENMMFLLEQGVDVQSIVTGLTRAAVMEGLHTIDVSLIIAPVLHEFIVGNAKALGIDFKEGFEDEGRKQKLEYARNKIRAKNKLKELGESPEEPKDIRDEMEGLEEMGQEEGVTENTMAEQEMPEAAPKKGLMARPE